jgi:hypothetical protein
VVEVRDQDHMHHLRDRLAAGGILIEFREEFWKRA